MSEEIFKKLRKEVNNKQLLIGVATLKLNRLDSPMFNKNDYTIACIFLGVPVVINFVYGGLKWGLLSAFCALILFLIYGRKWIFYRIKKRTISLVLSDYNKWCEYWDRGYLSLYNSNFPEEKYFSPNDSWEEFVHNHIIEDNTENNDVIKQTNQKGFFDELMTTIKSFIKWFVILVIIGGIIAFFNLN